jgi:GT2 family glycosyltransferase
MDLSIILVNWNAVDYLQDCIGSIYENTSGVELEVIVVDNSSTKGDVDTLKVPFPKILIIRSSENLGFARANNLGFTHSSAPYILLLNPDTKLVGPAINILWAAIKNLPDAGIVGCKHVNPDLTVQTTTIQKFPTIINQILNIEYLRLRWPACGLWNIAPLFSDSCLPVVVDVIPGACMLIKRDVFAAVGGFSEDYFMYGEDIDLNFKVARTGLRNYYIPRAVIIHYGGRSSTQQRASQWATTMKFRAMGHFYLKNHGHMYAAAYRVAMGTCAIVRLVLIGLAFPTGNMVWDKQAIRSALSKWSAVLKWALQPQA